MDVTDQILQSHIKYGGSDYNNPAYFSAQKSLNYGSPGGSITNPQQLSVKYFATDINWKDAVGLFGSENLFVKVTVDIDFSVVGRDLIVNSYEPARLSNEIVNASDPYTTANTGGPSPRSGQAYVDYTLDLTTVNDFEPAEMSGGIAKIADGVLSVILNNRGTGNQYVDKHLDVRLYNRDREEHPYDIMYVRPSDVFYIGFHARNTRRLPFDVSVRIGDEYKARTEVQFPAFVARPLAF